MPVTPNYKIDRRALPYPDAADLTAAATAGKQARQTFSETQKTVGAIWSSRLGIPADVIDLDDCFYDLGGHSLKAQEVLFDLKRRTGLKISMNTISQNASLRDFAAVIDAAQEAQQHHEGKTDSTPPEMDVSWSSSSSFIPLSSFRRHCEHAYLGASSILNVSSTLQSNQADKTHF